MPCKVCLRPKKAQIERQIAARDLTMSKAARIVGCHNSTVSRHMRSCVAPHVAEIARQQAREKQSIDIIQQLAQSHQTTQHILENALNQGQGRVALKALEVEIKQLELTAKLTGQLNEAPQVNFLLSPTYVQIKQVMMRVLEPYPDVREAMAQALLDAEATNKEAGNVDDTANDSVGSSNNHDNDGNNGQSKQY